MNERAKILNDWRIVPRLLVVAYGWFAVDVGYWFMALPDPTASQSAFVNVIWGASAAWFGLYVHSGNKS